MGKALRTIVMLLFCEVFMIFTLVSCDRKFVPKITIEKDNEVATKLPLVSTIELSGDLCLLDYEWDEIAARCVLEPVPFPRAKFQPLKPYRYIRFTGKSGEKVTLKVSKKTYNLFVDRYFGTMKLDSLLFENDDERILREYNGKFPPATIERKKKKPENCDELDFDEKTVTSKKLN